MELKVVSFSEFSSALRTMHWGMEKDNETLQDELGNWVSLKPENLILTGSSGQDVLEYVKRCHICKLSNTINTHRTN